MSTAHEPDRTAWVCTVDGDPWPCELARKELTAQLEPKDLREHMAWLQSIAASDLHFDDPARLYRRFVRWAQADTLTCGRCGKQGHQALAGLPPRLFPCRFDPE